MLFKNQYYYFIAGLPDFTFDSMKLPYTVQEFSDVLLEELKKRDYKLIQDYFLNFDNDNLLKLLRNDEAELHPMGTLSREELLKAVKLIQQGEPVKNKAIPLFHHHIPVCCIFTTFIQQEVFRTVFIYHFEQTAHRDVVNIICRLISH